MNCKKTTSWILVGKLLLIFCFWWGGGVKANITGVPALVAEVVNNSAHCYGSGTNIGTTASGDKFCWYTSSINPALFDMRNYFAPRYNTSLSKEFKTSYVPYNGLYRLREHICLASAVGWCTIANSVYVQDSVNSVDLNNTKDINSQNPNFGGGSKTIRPGGNFTICLSLVDDGNHEWRTNEPITCADANRLPETPATCYLNYGSDLNVEMGTLETWKNRYCACFWCSRKCKKNHYYTLHSWCRNDSHNCI